VQQSDDWLHGLDGAEQAHIPAVADTGTQTRPQHSLFDAHGTFLALQETSLRHLKSEPQ
jgi:hypothetical protein